MSQLFHFLGASRGCADFRDPTAVFRLKERIVDRIGQTEDGLETSGKIRRRKMRDLTTEGG
jgi:hypothetical protein